MRKIKPNMDKYDLARFRNTQSLYYQTALAELKAGKKESHWMWFIFPQLRALGHTETAIFYGISKLDEAKAYIEDEVLRTRLVECCEALLALESNDPEAIFGWPDYMKLKSCMTLFEIAASDNDIFKKVLDKFFNGERDAKTLEILSKQ